ncbi:CheR family methyltransferase [Sulfuricurvum sp.]|uniref:CheR family methyltransferase n=1 Tax=Sulfuricurvum sp. TaxID=2025608 RepID=UPI0026097E0E|nr:CheR family methyltransferase [Sulfuricurvum sp.]MDD4883242.1 methyltransferase domain-containing protein [Sulfuricurvum sp.]
MNEALITAILEQIQREVGIVLSRQSDRDRIGRYLENGGAVPDKSRPIPKELIELITTNETYFERESHHFDRLIDEILPELDTKESSMPIRILSAPCSSGEEVYTLALRICTLSRIGKRPVEIIGIDISEEMIEKARKGIYSGRSVHAVDKTVLERYFKSTENAYQVVPCPEIKIRFVTGNVFQDTLWKELGIFDVIFSRNMMIYFDAEKNKELLERFREHLKGFLIIGHADDHIGARELFTPLRSQRGIIYHV